MASAREGKSEAVWIRQWGNSEKEVREEGSSKTWKMVGGNLGRYVNIVTMHHEDVPTDVNTPKAKWAVNKANECLKKTTTDTSQLHPPWQVLRIEPVPQISAREMRWIVVPVPHGVYSPEVVERFHKEVIPDTFGMDTVHSTSVDLGKKAAVVKVIGVPISAGVGMDLGTRMILDN